MERKGICREVCAEGRRYVGVRVRVVESINLGEGRMVDVIWVLVGEDESTEMLENWIKISTFFSSPCTTPFLVEWYSCRKSYLPQRG